MKTMKKGLTFLGLLSVMLLGSCNGEPSSIGNVSSGTPSNSTSSSSTPIEDEGSFVVNFRGQEFAENGTLTLFVGDSTAQLVPTMIDETATGSFTYNSSDPTVAVVASNGLLTLKKAGTTEITVSEAASKETIKLTLTVTASEKAKNGHLYAGVDYEEKARVLATLEKYVVDNYLTGITIFSNGGKICYNTRYKPQVNQYISGYGWGTTREGSFSAPLQNSLTGKPMYYNVGTTSLPAHANAMNASGSDVSTVYDYISTSYYSTRMSLDGTAYEWYPSLAIDEAPVPVEEPEVNEDGTVKTPGAVITDTSSSTHKRWRIHLRSGSKFTGQKPVYRTASNDTFVKAFDNKEVTLQDYITPLQFMLTAWNGQYRGAELADGTSGFEGASDYYGKTSSRPKGNDDILNQDLWNQYMGKNIYVGSDDTGDFIEFNLLTPVTSFYAMYNLSSSLYSPLPASFIKHWGGSVLGKFDNASKGSPADTMLSTGPYYIEEWKDGQDILFKKNENYFHQEDTFVQLINGQETKTKRDCYKIDGISYFKVADASALKNHFLAGELDSYAPTAAEMKSGADFANDAGNGSNGMKWQKYDTLGDSNFKLNVNAATEEQWKERFGPTGTIYQHANKTQYTTGTWKALAKKLDGTAPTTGVKPYMSNVHFLNFISSSIDRKSISEGRGSIPTQEYFSDNYIIDPEKGTSYNSTEAHKAVLADRHNETYGFNKTYAQAELRKAFEDVIVPLAEVGAFSTKTGGTASNRNPYVVPIDMEWMNSNDKTDYSDVFENVKAFFKEVVDDDYGGQYELQISETNGNSDYQEVYNLMRRGEFDLGFGSISGNSLDPLNFLEVLKSDNSSGFTLNWGPDTSKVGDGLYSGDEANKNKIIYDGKEWSFDALWSAATTGVLLDNEGNIATVKNASGTAAKPDGYLSKDDTNQSLTYKLSFKTLIEGGAKDIKLQLSNNSYAEYNQIDVTDEEIEIEIPKEFNYARNQDTKEIEKDSENKDVKATVVTIKVTYVVELTDAATKAKVKSTVTTNLILPTYAKYIS